MVGRWCSQRLLCLNPTTVMVVLLLGLWLLLGCDNSKLYNSIKLILLDSLLQGVRATEIQTATCLIWLTLYYMIHFGKRLQRRKLPTATCQIQQSLTSLILFSKRFPRVLLSQPNNNHNPNNKTTITVVGLRPSNRLETTTHHTNSKLHDRAEIEQNSENKSY